MLISNAPIARWRAIRVAVLCTLVVGTVAATASTAVRQSRNHSERVWRASHSLRAGLRGYELPDSAQRGVYGRTRSSPASVVLSDTTLAPRRGSHPRRVLRVRHPRQRDKLHMHIAALGFDG